MGWLYAIADLMDIRLSKPWGDIEGQGGLACCSPWGCKKSDMTEHLNKTSTMHFHAKFSIWMTSCS